MATRYLIIVYQVEGPRSYQFCNYEKAYAAKGAFLRNGWRVRGPFPLVTGRNSRYIQKGCKR